MTPFRQIWHRQLGPSQSAPQGVIPRMETGKQGKSIVDVVAYKASEPASGIIEASPAQVGDRPCHMRASEPVFYIRRRI